MGERTVLVGLLHAELCDIETVINLEVATYMRHIQRVKAGLRVAQGCFHL